MSSQGMTAARSLAERSTGRVSAQYSLWQVLGIWLAAGAPMWLLGWGVYPAVSAGLDPVDAGLLRMKLLTLGLVWQFVLAMIIVYREEGDFWPTTIRRRFWLRHPISSRDGATRRGLWWWILPLIAFYGFSEMVLNPMLTDVWLRVFPFLADPGGASFGAALAPEMRARWVGNWGFVGLFFISALFNTFLGEELVFRGVLLPKMRGVFGRWDWPANALLFSLYHLHQPWGILGTLPADLALAFSGKHFHSNWFPIILHSTQTVFLLILVLGLVLGLG